MQRSDDLYRLPPGLPAPVDDGACDHLPGMELPSLALPSTGGAAVDPGRLPGRVVLFFYPRTGRPDAEIPEGWNAIPGARGCTPQACAFRDRHREIGALGARIFGVSTQTPAYQREAAERLRLPFDLLSDADLALTRDLRLPTFEFDSMTLIKRLTLVALRGRIEKVFYPVFPPDGNAGEILAWLRSVQRT